MRCAPPPRNVGDIVHTTACRHMEPAHGAAQAGAGAASRGGRGRSRGLLGSVVLAGCPARPGPAAAWLVPAVGKRDRRAHRPSGGECGRGAGLLPGAPGAEGAAPEMPQAGIPCPSVAPRRPGMPPGASRGPECGSLVRRGSGSPGAAGDPRPSRCRPGTCPRPHSQWAGGRACRETSDCTVCLQGKRQHLLSAFRSTGRGALHGARILCLSSLRFAHAFMSRFQGVSFTVED